MSWLLVFLKKYPTNLAIFYKTNNSYWKNIIKTPSNTNPHIKISIGVVETPS